MPGSMPASPWSGCPFSFSPTAWAISSGRTETPNIPCSVWWPGQSSIPSLTLYLSLSLAGESSALPWQPSWGSFSPSFLPYGICGIFRQSGLPKAVSGWISGICSKPLPWESAAVSTSLPLPWYRLCSTIPSPTMAPCLCTERKSP